MTIQDEPPADRLDLAQPDRLRIGVNEQWCRHCGRVVGPWMEYYPDSERSGHHIGRTSTCCEAPDLVAATSVLRPDEYIIVN